MKELGISDARLSRLLGRDEAEVRAWRIRLGVLPVVRQIDTLAAEYPAATNYLYTTYQGARGGAGSARTRQANDHRQTALILGSGPYRIGSSVEFDWCTVSAARALRAAGWRTVMLNHNPETVSTDYDECDALYFEETSFERVLDICEVERPQTVVLSVGGQTPNNLAIRLHRAGLPVLGTSPLDIDRAEDRFKFSALLDALGVEPARLGRTLHAGGSGAVRRNGRLPGAGAPVVRALRQRHERGLRRRAPARFPAPGQRLQRPPRGDQQVRGECARDRDRRRGPRRQAGHLCAFRARGERRRTFRRRHGDGAAAAPLSGDGTPGEVGHQAHRRRPSHHRAVQHPVPGP